MRRRVGGMAPHVRRRREGGTRTPRPPLWGDLPLKGGGVPLNGLVKRFENDLNNQVDARQHLVVPETDHTVALRFEPFRPRAVIFLMLAAISFHNQFGFGAEEIGDVAADRLLPTKAEAVDLSAAQPGP